MEETGEHSLALVAQIVQMLQHRMSRERQQVAVRGNRATDCGVPRETHQARDEGTIAREVGDGSDGHFALKGHIFVQSAELFVVSIVVVEHIDKVRFSHDFGQTLCLSIFAAASQSKGKGLEALLQRGQNFRPQALRQLITILEPLLHLLRHIVGKLLRPPLHQAKHFPVNNVRDKEVFWLGVAKQGLHLPPTKVCTALQQSIGANGLVLAQRSKVGSSLGQSERLVLT
mmetsp:Transcript_65462/g.156383  ORF Transcript_65462/g.156383 Transcript_65462/m.156383 type:complete len:229 (-) Transcript_65462:365-1051(-)